MLRLPHTVKSPLTKTWSFRQCLEFQAITGLHIFQPKVIHVLMFYKFFHVNVMLVGCF